MCVALSVLFVFYWFKQPSVVAYIVAGAVAGPFGLGVITDAGLIEVLGEFGIIMLLFFIGMEISVPSLIKNWRVVVLGSICQVLGSVGMMAILGHFFDWDLSRIIVLGFVISLSSTAVLLSYLQSKGMVDTGVGKDVIGVLLAQDLLIVPMLIFISSLSGAIQPKTIVLQIVGMVIIGIALFFVLKKDFKLPKFERLNGGQETDHQLFIAFIFCFGAALVASYFTCRSASVPSSVE